MAVNKWGTSKPRTAEFKIKLESIDEDDRSGSIWFGPHSNMNSLVDIDQPQHYSQQQTIQVMESSTRPPSYIFLFLGIIFDDSRTDTQSSNIDKFRSTGESSNCFTASSRTRKSRR